METKSLMFQMQRCMSLKCFSKSFPKSFTMVYLFFFCLPPPHIISFQLRREGLKYEFLTQSLYQLPVCPTFDHRDIKKKKSFQVSCQVYPGLDNKYSCGIEQPLGHGKHPKRGYKNTILPRARATFKDKQKRGFNNSSESCQQLVGPWPQMECKPYFYPAKSRRK